MQRDTPTGIFAMHYYNIMQYLNYIVASILYAFGLGHIFSEKHWLSGLILHCMQKRLLDQDFSRESRVICPKSIIILST